MKKTNLTLILMMIMCTLLIVGCLGETQNKTAFKGSISQFHKECNSLSDVELKNKYLNKIVEIHSDKYMVLPSSKTGRNGTVIMGGSSSDSIYMYLYCSQLLKSNESVEDFKTKSGIMFKGNIERIDVKNSAFNSAKYVYIFIGDNFDNNSKSSNNSTYNSKSVPSSNSKVSDNRSNSSNLGHGIGSDYGPSSSVGADITGKNGNNNHNSTNAVPKKPLSAQKPFYDSNLSFRNTKCRLYNKDSIIIEGEIYNSNRSSVLVKSIHLNLTFAEGIQPGGQYIGQRDFVFNDPIKVAPSSSTKVTLTHKLRRDQYDSLKRYRDLRLLINTDNKCRLYRYY